MTDKIDNIENIETAETKEPVKSSVSPLEGEGLRGDGTAKWYVVHTYSGYENKVKNSIDRMVEYRGMQDLIQEVVIPTEDRIEIKDGVKKVKTRKLFPGYVVIKMVVNNETWYLVRNTEGVTGFVGHGSDPIPLTKEEIVRMGIEKLRIDLDIEVGDTIRIIGGVFEGQLGIVEAINPEKQIVKVRISMFGRDTPAEIEFSQVSKLRGYIKLQIPAGGATPAPPVGPALGQKSVNIMDFCKQFNARTQDQAGMIIPVVITVYTDRSFDFVCKTPPAAVLIKKAAGIEHASGTPNKEKVASITLAQAEEIAKTKMPDLNAASLEAAVDMIKGTARSMGVTVVE